MPLAAPVVFPLFGIVDGKCACGKTDCARVGKHPAVSWGELAAGDPVPRPAPGAGYGIKTGAAPRGSGVIVVDLDGPEAAENFAAFGECPDTYTVTTARGLHLYFAHPGFPVRNSASDLARGVDVRGEGGFVVGVDSPHRSGTPYALAHDVLPAPAPAWLLAWLRSRPAPASVQPAVGDIIDPTERARRRELYTKYLQTEAPARGPALRGKGDSTLFEVVQRGAYDLALPTADVIELVAEHYDPRCSPPWGDELEERVLHKANDAKKNSTRPRAEPVPADLAELFEGTRHAPVELPAQAKPDGGLPVIWGRWDEPSVPPPYLLAGLIPSGKVCCFFAEGGSVKSWAAFALAIAVSTGLPWLGCVAVKQGRALIIDFEDGREEFKRRGHILTQDDADMPELGYLYGVVNLADENAWRAFATMGLTLLVVDALASGMPIDADENDPRFASAIKYAGRFTEATGCTVLFIHHANKQGGIRGSSAIRDQCDVVFRFDPVEETDDTKRMRMICDKPGPQKKPAPVNLELSDDGLCTFKDEANELGRNITGSDTLEAVKHAVRLCLNAGAKESLLDVQEAVGVRAGRVRDAIKAMRESGEVAKTDDGYVLDSDEKRSARVLACLRGKRRYYTAPELAAGAYTESRFVVGMLQDGIIYQSGDKSFGERL